jgi:7-cyano-7-deazaguanine synthase
MDSSTLLHLVARERPGAVLYACTFLYGQKHEREVEMARRQAAAVRVREHRLVDLAGVGDLIADASVLTDPGRAVPDLAVLDAAQRRHPPTYVPNRNMMLLAIAAAYAEARGAQDVFYGAQAQDEYGYWDCTVDFVRRMNDCLRLNRGRAVTVHAPLAGLPKAEVLRRGLALGVNFADTWSCYRGGAAPCGTCPTCVERTAAFRACGLSDPLGTDRTD